MRCFYDHFGTSLWGIYGFHDAFNETENWFSQTYLAIDEGPIIVNVENYRSQFCWRLFMSNPEIRPALHDMDWTFDGDFDDDGDLDASDFAAMLGCLTSPDTPTGCIIADMDDDTDADVHDVALFQQAYSLP